MKACVDLVKELDGYLAGIAVLIELNALQGRKRLAPHPVHSVLQY
jgi:adenine/guanine phosphoribosyltransferase-like PRPP-binding protein